MEDLAFIGVFADDLFEEESKTAEKKGIGVKVC
jgi:hypothetical protein